MVLRLTRHNIGHCGDVSPSQSLRLTRVQAASVNLTAIATENAALIVSVLTINASVLTIVRF